MMAHENNMTSESKDSVNIKSWALLRQKQYTAKSKDLKLQNGFLNALNYTFRSSVDIFVEWY